MVEHRVQDAWLPLRETRAQLMEALDNVTQDEPRRAARTAPSGVTENFPRSRLLRSLLTRERGAIWILGLALAAWKVNPRLAASLVRRLPVGMLLERFLGRHR